MKHRTLTILILAGVALLGMAFGLGYGLGRGGRDREAGAPEVSGTMRPVMPSGASPVAEQAARGEIREFVPVRPFAKGEAEAWLLGLRGKEFASMRKLFTLETAAAKEVLAMIVAIQGRLEKGDGDTTDLWKSEADTDLLDMGLKVTLGILAAQDPESAVASLNALGNAKLVRIMWPEIARHAPGRLDALLADVAPELLAAAVESSLSVLLESDVEATIALAMKYPGEEFDSHRRYMVGHLLKSDPQRALALASTMVGDGQGSEPLWDVINGWLKVDEAAARQWVDEYDGPGRDHARASLLSHDAAREPEAALAQFAAIQNEGVAVEALVGAVRAIVGGLGQADPHAARTWLDTLPAGSLRDDAVPRLAEIWARQDPLAASEWIATLPPGKQRDSGASHLVEAIRKRDPAAALDWARNVSEEGRRRTMIAEVLEEWRGQDPEAAEAAALGLPEEDRPTGDR